MTPQAYVLSRGEPRLTARVRTLGGGWSTAASIWAASDAPFCLLLAADEYRVRRRAPFAVICATRDALERAIGATCSHLSDAVCKWHIADDVRDAVLPLLLADAVPVGGRQ